jgi:hypothetical protein
VDGSDPFFRAMVWSNRTVYLAGVRYDILPTAASLKVEAHFINDSGTNFTELASAWGFAF